MPFQSTKFLTIGVMVAMAALFIYMYSLQFLGYVSTPFDPTDRELVCYMDRYPELKESFGGDIALARQHWYKVGALEGRVPHCPRPYDAENMPQRG
jgi:hypothetical protein